jgi:hypothetical protein
MNDTNKHTDLIDLVEGTLDHDRRILLEEEIRRTPELQNKLDELRRTMELLSRQDEDAPDPRYFQNFIPRLRIRIDGGYRRRQLWIPSWFTAASAPAAAAVIIGVMMLLYVSLQPDAADTSMDSIFITAEPVDIENVDPFPLKKYYFDGSVSDLFDDDDVFERSLFAGSVIGSASMYENDINDDRMMAQMNDTDVDMIVAYLRDRTVQ